MSTKVSYGCEELAVSREYKSNILRYAFAVMIPLCVMVFFQWEMAYITPTLVTVLVGPPTRPFPKKLYLRFFLVMLASLVVGILLVRLVEPYPVVTIIIMSWILYGIFYRAAQGTNLLFTLLLLLSVLSYPSMAMLDIALSMNTALGVITSYLLALFTAATMYVILPPENKPGSAVATPAVNKTVSEISGTAFINTLVVLPALIAVLMFDIQEAMLALIYIAILVPNNCLRKGVRTCLGLLIANLVGGIVAIIIYELLVVVPLCTFYLCLMLFVGLLFAKRVFTSPSGALYGSAFSCVLLLITNVMNTTGSHVDYAFYERWGYIAIANIYVIACFMILTSLGWIKLSQT